MGILRKTVNALTGNTLKLLTEVDEPISRSEAIVTGTLRLNSKKDQTLQKVVLTVTEYFQTGRGKNKNFQELEVGKTVMAEGSTLEGKIEKLISFAVPLSLQTTKNDELKAKGGLSAVRGKWGKFVAGEKASYSLRVEVIPEGKAESLDEVHELNVTD